MYGFSKKTLDYLHHAGWYEGRACGQLDEYKIILNKKDFELSDTIEQFLKHFGGLFIKYPHAKVRDAYDDFHFDVIKAINGGDSNWVSGDYSARTGEELCVIGEAFRRDMVLSMSPTGKVYSGADDFLTYVGASGEEAIEALCTGRELEQVPELVIPIDVTVELLNNFFGDERIQNRFRFINGESKDWLKTEFAFFLAQSYQDLKWQPQTPDDTFDFTFNADGKQYAINIGQYQPTQTGLKKLIEGDWNKRLQHANYDNCALTLVGIHPKTEMKPADIEKFVMTETKKVGLEIPHYDIKTAFIPKTDYAFTAFMIEQ
jgi:hypothetical protein